jgi:membrane associated rhomboid family serine protease
MFPIRDDVPSTKPAFASLALILANTVVFLVVLRLPAREIERCFDLFGIVPARFTHPVWAARHGLPIDWWPFLTSLFLHGGWLHLIGNMWTLWIFGDNVEDRMGAFRFLLFYLVCGIAAGLVHSLTNANATVPAVGASGAIAGVLGAYLALFPFARILVLFPVIIYPLFFELPALLYLGLWFLLQFASGTAALAGPRASEGIAWWAHIGGFATGVLLHRFFLSPTWKRRRRAVGD